MADERFNNDERPRKAGCSSRYASYAWRSKSLLDSCSHRDPSVRLDDPVSVDEKQVVGFRSCISEVSKCNGCGILIVFDPGTAELCNECARLESLKSKGKKFMDDRIGDPDTERFCQRCNDLQAALEMETEALDEAVGECVKLSHALRECHRKDEAYRLMEAHLAAEEEDDSDEATDENG